MNDGKRELKRCPICGSLPRYWQWNHGAIVECWCKDHRIQCEGKTLEEAVEAWERRADLEPRWTPITDGLPEEDGRYLITGKRGTVYSLEYEDERWYGGIQPIAWMPLPEPYKEGEQNG